MTPLEVYQKHKDEMCRLKYTYGDRHCILGWMAVEAGISLPRENTKMNVREIRSYGRLNTILRKRYGLDGATLTTIQVTADNMTKDELEEYLKRLTKQSR